MNKQLDWHETAMRRAAVAQAEAVTRCAAALERIAAAMNDEGGINENLQAVAAWVNHTGIGN